MSTLEALEELKNRLAAIKVDLDNVQVEVRPPTIEDVAESAAASIRRVMNHGSSKSAYGEWFTKDSIRYNSDRAISHICQAMKQLDGNVPLMDANGETGIDHLERALCRVAFLLEKIKRTPMRYGLGQWV